MLRGRGALAGWFDYAGDCDMNEWQAREHILERVAGPGFIRGRRFEAETGSPRYFMLYETTDAGVFTSPAYLARLNDPTEWSTRCAPGLSNMVRSLCAVTASVGAVDGGSVSTAEIVPGPRGNDVRELLRDAVLDELVRQQDVYAAHLLEVDRAASEVTTVEKQLRGSQDRVAEWALVIEGRDPAPLGAAVERLDVAGRLRALGAELPGGWRTFRLSFSATADSVTAPA